VHEIQWKKIWKIIAQPKVKQFMWRLAHNSLATKRNIQSRGIECDTRCVCCNRLGEDGAHLFLKCKEVRRAWMVLKLDQTYNRMCQAVNAKEVVQIVLSLKEEECSLICHFLWKWWTRRNRINAKENVGRIEDAIAQARKWTADALQFCRQRLTEVKIRESAVWTPPSGEFLKINTDGAFQAESRTGGWGFVIRDCDCSIRGSGAGLLTHVTSAAQAEAQACTEALHAAADWGMSQVHIESDSQNLVCALQSSDFDLAPEGVSIGISVFL
jgi:hypothetical protein